MENKSKIDILREKLYNKKREEQIEEAETIIQEDSIAEEAKFPIENFTYTTYDVFQDPEKKGRHFIIAEIKYNPVTMKAEVTDVRDFEDKTAGLAFVMDKDNRKYLFNKSRRRKV